MGGGGGGGGFGVLFYKMRKFFFISTQKRCLQFDVYFILFRKKDESD